MISVKLWFYNYKGPLQHFSWTGIALPLELRSIAEASLIILQERGFMNRLARLSKDRIYTNIISLFFVCFFTKWNFTSIYFV